MQFSWVRQLPHTMAVVVRRRCLVMVFEKPEVTDKLDAMLACTQPLTTLA